MFQLQRFNKKWYENVIMNDLQVRIYKEEIVLCLSCIQAFILGEDTRSLNYYSR
jgi:hypothetical protein